MKILILLSLLALVAAVDLCDVHVFNWNFYLSHNKDLIRARIGNATGACKHWKERGANEGRQAHPTFHSKQYCENYPDLKKNGLCNDGQYIATVMHFLEKGMKENRKGYNLRGTFGTWTIENGLFSVCASRIHGGSISSIVYKGRDEMVNSYDRGRQMQFAFCNSKREDDNPTEGGSEKDGISDYSTSQILGITTKKNFIATTSNPALWRGGLSKFKVSKRVTLNVNGDKHLMSFDIDFYMAQTYDWMSLECPTQYMPIGFTKVYLIDVAKKSYKRVPLPENGKVVYTTNPIIYENSRGVAVGMRGISYKGMNNPTFHYCYFGLLSYANDIDWTTKWSAWYHNGVPVTLGTRITTKVYVAIGTPREVFDALMK